MKPARAVGLAVALALASVATAASAQTASQVRIRSLDGTDIAAEVFLPKNAPRGTVIALHGCGGLYSSVRSRAGELSARHQAMADLLVAQGYAVVMPDSLGPRGEKEICTQRLAGRQVKAPERRADALGAAAWVRAQPWGQAPLALLGWSHGGSAVLAATDAARADVREHPVQLAVAFYPGCTAFEKAGWRPAAPLLLMLGEKDDWTPPAPCIELGRRVGAEVNVYPGAYHDFDHPTAPVRLRRDVPNGVNPGQGVHAGGDPAARQAAYARLLQVLGERLR